MEENEAQMPPSHCEQTSTSATYLCLAEYLPCELRVHTDSECWVFRPSNEPTPSSAALHLSIIGKHCRPASLCESLDT
eukprot:6483063-Amphidinium_carterae.1